MRKQLKVSVRAYTFGILPLIKFLVEFIHVNKMNAKEIAFADNFSVTGSLNSIKNYWDKLTANDPKYGYFPKPAKSYLKVKENKLIKPQTLHANSRVNITTEGKRHLGAVTRSTGYRDECVKGLVTDWNNQVIILSTIAETQLQAVYLLLLETN